MKKINFATFTKDETEPRFWVIVNGVILVCAVLFFVSTNLICLPSLYRAYFQHKELISVRTEPSDAAEYARLQKECADYRARVAKLKQRKIDPRSPLIYLRALASNNKKPIRLQRLRLDKNSMELSLNCREPQQAVALVETLRRLPGVLNSSLVSLEAHYDANSAADYTCVIRGKLKSRRSS